MGQIFLMPRLQLTVFVLYLILDSDLSSSQPKSGKMDRYDMQKSGKMDSCLHGHSPLQQPWPSQPCCLGHSHVGRTSQDLEQQGPGTGSPAGCHPQVLAGGLLEQLSGVWLISTFAGKPGDTREHGAMGLSQAGWCQAAASQDPPWPRASNKQGKG